MKNRLFFSYLHRYLSKIVTESKPQNSIKSLHKTEFQRFLGKNQFFRSKKLKKTIKPVGFTQITRCFDEEFIYCKSSSFHKKKKTPTIGRVFFPKVLAQSFRLNLKTPLLSPVLFKPTLVEKKKTKGHNFEQGPQIGLRPRTKWGTLQKKNLAELHFSSLNSFFSIKIIELFFRKKVQKFITKSSSYKVFEKFSFKVVKKSTILFFSKTLVFGNNWKYKRSNIQKHLYSTVKVYIFFANPQISVNKKIFYLFNTLFLPSTFFFSTVMFIKPFDDISNVLKQHRKAQILLKKKVLYYTLWFNKLCKLQKTPNSITVYQNRNFKLFSCSKNKFSQYSNWKKFVVIRPFFSITRLDTFYVCESAKLPVYPDKSNLQVHFLRNRVRKQILPAIRILLNPQFDIILSRLSEFAV